jgi:L-serine dehydratase
LGLAGLDPVTIDVDSIEARIDQIAVAKSIKLMSTKTIDFDPETDIVFHKDIQLPFHPNAIRFTAHLADATGIDALFYSIGGGFIVKEGDRYDASEKQLPCPIDRGEQLLEYCCDNNAQIADVVLQNELSWRAEAEVREGLCAIRDAMLSSIHRGCRTQGELPGGLKVQRRAATMAANLLGRQCPASRADWISAIQDQPRDFQTVLDWVSCFALAVNEENAAMGRIVTAPTNGAAGVIPAVMFYSICFCDLCEDAYIDFLLTAGEIGCLFKKGATISAAMGGCQAEIGVSSAMAAAALTECLGGSPAQATEAAEIAMEHHLGLTCDPIGGLVQIPCIERNAMGAVKAITAAQLALQRDPAKARVSLDAVIRTMWQTAQDMDAKYKETSEGGLAIAVNLCEC